MEKIIAKSQLTHGDKILMVIGSDYYIGHIEERMLNQWPDKRTELVVVIDSTEMPHFPINVDNFIENFGEIYKYFIRHEIKKEKI